MLISLSCSEVTIKGANRRRFEDILESNIRAALSGMGPVTVSRRAGRMLVTAEGGQEDAFVPALGRVFGIDSISVCAKTAPDLAEIEKTVLASLPELQGRKIRVEAKRSDKGFPLGSQEVNRRIGAALVRNGCGVDLENPQKTVYVDILKDEALVSLGKSKGLGGLPVGSSGRLLSLLSGGIDSPVSSWMMMKRGCSVDLLHVHQSRGSKDVLGSKISRLAAALRAYSPKRVRLYLAPYDEFYKKAMSADGRRETVLFRRFLFRLGSALAEKHGYQGLVTGDSVGQVASQTLQNILATDEASGVPVFRPLAAFNKQEIVDLAERIGTYRDSLEDYKDCCSLISSRSPSTSVPREAARRMEAAMGMDSIVAKTLEQIEAFDI